MSFKGVSISSKTRLIIGVSLVGLGSDLEIVEGRDEGEGVNGDRQSLTPICGRSHKSTPCPTLALASWEMLWCEHYDISDGSQRFNLGEISRAVQTIQICVPLSPPNHRVTLVLQRRA